LLNLKDPSAGTAISAAAVAPAAGMAVSNAAGTAAAAGAAARAPPCGLDCPVVSVKTKLPTVRQVWRDPGRDKLANALFTIALQQGPHLTPADQGGKSIKGWEKFTTTVTNPGDGCLCHYLSQHAQACSRSGQRIFCFLQR
jgi:hypothetical protein